MHRSLSCLLLLFTTLSTITAQQFENARPKDPEWFPLAVWLQSPHNAKRYRDIGINLYVGLFNGPTSQQLAALDSAKMRVICHQNEVGLAHKGETIIAWMHGDEPDNAQGRRLRGYKPPIKPWQVVADFEAMKKLDPRPVLLNLGQGAAWDGWYGRGERTNHPEDYPQYVKGCDIVSFDIYPVTHSHRDVRGKLEFVGRGVRRLRKYSQQQKPVWACIETGHVNNPNVRPTPAQVRTEVWQAIACGADGIIYFAHEFAPKFVEAGLLAHEDVRAGVAALNREVRSLASVLNSPKIDQAVRVTSKPKRDIALRVHRYRGALYLFAASMSEQPCAVTVAVEGQPNGKVKALHEHGNKGRAQRLRKGRFEIELGPYGIAHYRITR